MKMETFLCSSSSFLSAMDRPLTVNPFSVQKKQAAVAAKREREKVKYFHDKSKVMRQQQQCLYAINPKSLFIHSAPRK